MEITQKPLHRFASWVKRHKLPIFITSAVIVGVGIAAAVFFIFIMPGNQSSENSPADNTPPPPPPKYYSRLSGHEISSDELNSSPVTCIMIENSPSARPHSGLDQAPIIYEAIAEGGITRFLTIWQNANSQLIGPVRSLRLYYLDWATPYNCSIAHVGGAESALAAVRNPANGYRDIDQFFNGNSYWRASDRSSPHNVYTSYALMEALNAAKGYTASEFTAFPRSKDPAVAAETPAYTTISMNISSVNYNPIYTYDPTTNTYLRAYQNGTPHMTTTTCAEKERPQVKDCNQVQIAPNVIIAMLVEQGKTHESSGYTREDIETTGTGKAHVFQNGEVIEATWSRATIHDPLVFTNTVTGEPIVFNQGQIWISAIPSSRGPATWQ